MKVPRPKTQAIYDQIIAKLRDAHGLPMTTKEVAEGLTQLETRAPDVRLWRDEEVVARPVGVFVVRTSVYDGDAYRHLKQLESKGVVRCLRVKGMQSVFWQLVSEQAVLE